MDRNVIGDVMGKALAESLSARRAWIEIPSIHLLTDRFFVALRKESVDRNHKDLTQWFRNYGSLSARRAWIEIFKVFSKVSSNIVALRKESVDRNHPGNPRKRAQEASLSARRAGIEI